MASEAAVSAEQEKHSAALSSVVAAVFLTSFKIVVGLMTGSLGILSEAAHSGLDLVAALITFLAVRIGGKPADEHHTYAHGKVENFSALAETLLLLGTSGWIIYEAIQRLTGKEVEIEISIWAFLVMGLSIVIDYTRSRMLYRAARKHNSQALEADALHFSTDIWSSAVVIVGLIAVWLSERVPALAFLSHADAVSALIVALIVIFVSLQLGRRTVDALLDTAPAGLPPRIEATVETMPGVLDCHRVRVRTSGPHTFIDAHAVLDGQLTLDEAHAVVQQIEAAVRQLVPGADVVIHVDPASVLQHAQPNPPAE
jgi:cation diffusion facilitator family transporter